MLEIVTQHQDLPSYFVISLVKLKESLTLNSLWVKGSKIGIKNFARLYLGVLIAELVA